MDWINNQSSGAIVLNHLSIQNFAIVDHLEVDLNPGMTVITGETGAGKSIMLDALALAVGGRADSSVVPAGKARTEIAVSLDVRDNAAARQWLAGQQLEAEDSTECLLRRTVSADGRSRAWINGQPVTLQQLKAFGAQLVDIHSQHEHQSLLLRDTHRHLLDAWAACDSQAEVVREAFVRWKATQDKLATLRSQSDEHDARRQLLRYQVDELDQLGLQTGELAALEREQEQLANVESSLQAGQQVLDICQHGDGETAAVIDGLDRALFVLAEKKAKSAALCEAEKMLETARIQIEEACREVEQHQRNLEIDPERLQEVEARMSLVYRIARKHRVSASELVALHEKLNAELRALSVGESNIDTLEQQLAQQWTEYQGAAARLGEARATGSVSLAKAVNRELKRLNMQGCQFSVALEARQTPAATGMEQVEFLVATNPGQPFMPLKKVASGGELSRLSLAIQVVTAQTSAIPTLVFDEVDVGIGGETAAVVGQLLRKLGESGSGKSGQVICVTHQGSVAAKAHHHLFVTKAIHKDAQGNRAVKTALMALGEQDRINEVARMISGQQTAESRAHAGAMLKAISWA